jgi:hypothetical protein
VLLIAGGPHLALNAVIEIDREMDAGKWRTYAHRRAQEANETDYCIHEAQFAGERRKVPENGSEGGKAEAGRG